MYREMHLSNTNLMYPSLYVLQKSYRLYNRLLYIRKTMATITTSVHHIKHEFSSICFRYYDVTRFSCSRHQLQCKPRGKLRKLRHHQASHHGRRFPQDQELGITTGLTWSHLLLFLFIVVFGCGVIDGCREIVACA